LRDAVPGESLDGNQAHLWLAAVVVAEVEVGQCDRDRRWRVEVVERFF
jgi:hypothetical protein